MEIEIEVIGRPNRWVVNQSPVRIGRGPSCEVALPSRQFPSVAPVHAELEMVNGALRLAAVDDSEGTVDLNGQPVDAGAFILSGDVLQLGPQGPQLRVQYRETAPTRGSYEPTRVMQTGEVASRDATRVMASPEPPGRMPTQVMNVPMQSPESSRSTPPLSGRPAQKGSFGDAHTPSPAKPVPNPVMRMPAASPAAAQATAHTIKVEKSLRTMQILQVASLLVIVVLGVMVFRLQSEVSSNQSELTALRAQNANAVSALTPALDARLNAFGQRMDSIDATMRDGEARMEHGLDVKMKAAQDQLFANLDLRMKATEDHMVNRMNTDLPPLLDKYVTAKLTELKR
jgi:pSer/pThr/pTyr-binding forkhead associated (FHA) protein